MVPDDDCIPVWVDTTEYQGGTLAFGYGETPTGQRVKFGGEPRALYAITEALENGDGPVLAAVPVWSLLWVLSVP